MKFGKQFKRFQIAEWVEYYLDYSKLKKFLKVESPQSTINDNNNDEPIFTETESFHTVQDSDIKIISTTSTQNTNNFTTTQNSSTSKPQKKFNRAWLREHFLPEIIKLNDFSAFLFVVLHQQKRDLISAIEKGISKNRKDDVSFVDRLRKNVASSRRVRSIKKSYEYSLSSRLQFAQHVRRSFVKLLDFYFQIACYKILKKHDKVRRQLQKTLKRQVTDKQIAFSQKIEQLISNEPFHCLEKLDEARIELELIRREVINLEQQANGNAHILNIAAGDDLALANSDFLNSNNGLNFSSQSPTEILSTINDSKNSRRQKSYQLKTPATISALPFAEGGDDVLLGTLTDGFEIENNMVSNIWEGSNSNVEDESIKNSTSLMFPWQQESAVSVEEVEPILNLNGASNNSRKEVNLSRHTNNNSNKKIAKRGLKRSSLNDNKNELFPIDEEGDSSSSSQNERTSGDNKNLDLEPSDSNPENNNVGSKNNVVGELLLKSAVEGKKYNIANRTINANHTALNNKKAAVSRQKQNFTGYCQTLNSQRNSNLILGSINSTVSRLSRTRSSSKEEDAINKEKTVDFLLDLYEKNHDHAHENTSHSIHSPSDLSPTLSKNSQHSHSADDTGSSTHAGVMDFADHEDNDIETEEEPMTISEERRNIQILRKKKFIDGNFSFFRRSRLSLGNLPSEAGGEQRHFAFGIVPKLSGSGESKAGGLFYAGNISSNNEGGDCNGAGGGGFCSSLKSYFPRINLGKKKNEELAIKHNNIDDSKKNQNDDGDAKVLNSTGNKKSQVTSWLEFKASKKKLQIEKQEQIDELNKPMIRANGLLNLHRLAFFLAVFILGIQVLCMLSIQGTSKIYSDEAFIMIFPVFRLFFLLIVTIWLAGWVLNWLIDTGINYSFLLNIDRNCEVQPNTLFGIASVGFGLWAGVFAVFLADFKFGMALSYFFPETFGKDLSTIVLFYPAVLAISLIGLFFGVEYEGLKRSSRFKLLKAVGCCFCAPFLAVPFSHVVICDVLTSLAVPIQDFVFMGCFFTGSLITAGRDTVDHIIVADETVPPIGGSTEVVDPVVQSNSFIPLNVTSNSTVVVSNSTNNTTSAIVPNSRQILSRRHLMHTDSSYIGTNKYKHAGFYCQDVVYGLNAAELDSPIENFFVFMLKFVLAWPYLLRLLQCLRRYHDTNDRWNLVNAGKYSVSILVNVLSNVLGKLGTSSDHNTSILLTALLIATAYSFAWDFKRDWGLSMPPGFPRPLGKRNVDTSSESNATNNVSDEEQGNSNTDVNRKTVPRSSSLKSLKKKSSGKSSGRSSSGLFKRSSLLSYDDIESPALNESDASTRATTALMGSNTRLSGESSSAPSKRTNNNEVSKSTAHNDTTDYEGNTVDVIGKSENEWSSADAKDKDSKSEQDKLIDGCIVKKTPTKESNANSESSSAKHSVNSKNSKNTTSSCHSNRSFLQNSLLLVPTTMLLPNFLYYIRFLFINAIGRTSWASATLIPQPVLTQILTASPILTGHLMLFVLALLEIFRRAQWCVLRLEHEHLASRAALPSFFWVPLLKPLRAGDAMIGTGAERIRNAIKSDGESSFVKNFSDANSTDQSRITDKKNENNDAKPSVDGIHVADGVANTKKVKW